MNCTENSLFEKTTMPIFAGLNLQAHRDESVNVPVNDPVNVPVKTEGLSERQKSEGGRYQGTVECG